MLGVVFGTVVTLAIVLGAVKLVEVADAHDPATGDGVRLLYIALFVGLCGAMACTSGSAAGDTVPHSTVD